METVTIMERVIFRHSQQALAASLAAVALAVWAVVSVSILNNPAVHLEPFAAFTYISAALWLLAGVAILCLLVWILFGQRVVAVRDGTLTVAIIPCGFSLYESSRIELQKPTDLRVTQYISKSKGKSMTKFALVTGAPSRERRLPADLSREQADALLGSPVWQVVGTYK
jgi:hypothetical protein